jgi:hypothetical protein
MGVAAWVGGGASSAAPKNSAINDVFIDLPEVRRTLPGDDRKSGRIAGKLEAVPRKHIKAGCFMQPA